jgi:O-antigen/teichoic acid export membrane protein
MAEKKILNKIVKGAGFTMFGLFFSKFLSYFYRIVVARIGPEAYGQLSLGLAVAGFIGTFVKLGLDESIKKFVPEAREAEDDAMLKGIMLDSLKLITLSGFLMGVITFFSADFIAQVILKSPETAPIIRILAFFPLVGRAASVFTDTTIGFNTTKYRVILRRITQNILQLAITLVLISIGMGVTGAAIGWFTGSFLILLISAYVVERDFGPILTSDVKAKKMYPKMIKFSYPLIFSGVVGTFLGWGDSWLLSYFMNDAAVGIYNAAYPTALMIVLPAQAISSLALSSFSELGAKGYGQKKALKTTTRWVFAMSFPAFLLMALFPGDLLHLLFGAEYAQAGTALAILAFGNMIGTSTGQLGAYLKSNSHTKIIAYNTTLNMIFNLGLNILLIPKLGIVGAALATAASSIFINTVVLAEVYRIKKTHPFSKDMLKILPAGLLALAATYTLVKLSFTHTPRWALIPAGITFAATYTLTFLKTGGLTQYDKEIITTAGRKIGLEKQAEKILEILT